MNMLARLWDRWRMTFVLVLAGSAFALGLNANRQDNVQQDDLIEYLGEINVANCEADHAFREQYKHRAEEEKRIARRQAILAQVGFMLVPKRHDAIRRKLAQVREQAEAGAGRIVIIPLPDCAAQQHHLLNLLNAR